VSRHNHSVPAEGGDEERWLLTYSDMITLLLALFVVLFALSSVNKVKFDEFRSGLQATFVGASSAVGASSLLTQANLGPPQPLDNPVHGVTSPLTAVKAPVGVSEPRRIAPATSSELNALEEAIHARLGAERLLDYVTIVLQPDRLTVGLLADSVFFATNSNNLSHVGDEIVDSVGEVLAPRTNDISVQGYADNVPVTGPPWHSNFLLSAARAAAVVLRMAHVDGVSENRLVAEGFGSTDPIASNATAAGRARNRRVEIVILPERT